MFFGLWLENVRILSVSFRQLWQNCIYVSIGLFWGNRWFLKVMYFPGSLIEKFWTFDGVFPQVCQNNIQSVQRKALRDLILRKYFKSILHSLRQLRWAFQIWILRVERFILRKIVYHSGKPKLCYSILALEQRKSVVFPKYIGCSVWNYIELSRLKFCWKVWAKSFEIFVQIIIGKLLKVDST